LNADSLRNRLTHELQEIRDDTAAAQPRFRKSPLKWIAWSAGLVVVLGYLLLTKVPVTEFVHELLTCNPWWLLATAVLLVITRSVMALKWWVILQGEGIRLPFFYIWHVTFVSYFLGSFVPSGLGLEAVRVWYLARDHGIGAVGMASAVIDRAISVAALAIVTLVALLSLDQPFLGEKLIDIGAAALFLGFVAATCLAPTLSRWLERHRPTKRTSWLRRVWAKAHDVAVYASKMQGRKSVVARALLLGVLVQLLRSLEVYLVFVALGYPQLLGAILALAPVIMFIGMIPVGLSPVAISAGAFVLLLEPVGVPASASLSGSLIVDALGWFMVPVGAAVFWAKRSGTVSHGRSAHAA
jgi:uncharacterized protein (TIRG00374 family)